MTLFPYRWKLTDLQGVTPNGYRVFSCFSCGGGSTMGYKLAGFKVVGNVEIDPQMMRIYQANHHPAHPFEMDIRAFNHIPQGELPTELFDLDILDGSPPLRPSHTALWMKRKFGDKSLAQADTRRGGKGSFFNSMLLYDKRVVPTITSTEAARHIRYDMPYYMGDDEIILSQTFPMDYDFGNAKVQYVCGMSVPPVMMAHIAEQIRLQWLDPGHKEAAHEMR